MRGLRARAGETDGSMGVDRRKIRCRSTRRIRASSSLIRTPVPNDGRVTLDDGAAQSGDLIARRLVFGVSFGLHRRQIRGDVGTQRMDFGFQLGPEFAELRLGRHSARTPYRRECREAAGERGFRVRRPWRAFIARPSERGKARAPTLRAANFSKDFQAFPKPFQTFPSFFQAFSKDFQAFSDSWRF